jgi:hypothetical protein
MDPHELPLRLGLNSRRFQDGQRYYVYLSDQAAAAPQDASLLVAVHGYNGRLDNSLGRLSTEGAALRWRALAERMGWVILSPQFDAGRFNNDYQRLSLGAELRADLRLHDILAGLIARPEFLDPRSLA